MITMLTKLSALASGITDLGRRKESGEAGPLIMHGHTVSVLLLLSVGQLNYVLKTSSNELLSQMHTCPVLFGLSWMTKTQTDCTGIHKQHTYESDAQTGDFICL